MVEFKMHHSTDFLVTICMYGKGNFNYVNYTELFSEGKE